MIIFQTKSVSIASINLKGSRNSSISARIQRANTLPVFVTPPTKDQRPTNELQLPEFCPQRPLTQLRPVYVTPAVNYLALLLQLRGPFRPRHTAANSLSFRRRKSISYTMIWEFDCRSHRSVPGTTLGRPTSATRC